MSIHIWLRDEVKKNEERSALSPRDAQKLLSAGAKVTVESSINRIFKDQEYLNIGCDVVSTGSWKDAPISAYILGLKELPVSEDTSFIHKHIYFAHSYKKQDNAQLTLNSYKRGTGTLFDLEYLVDDNNRRIAAFGMWAGFVGTALAIDNFYYKQLETSPYPHLKSYPNQDTLISSILEKKKKSTVHPKIMTIGALGRCGHGANLAAKLCGLEVTGWDREETKNGGPFKETLEHNIFINCALVNIKMPPFINFTLLENNKSNLSVIADVGCDPTSELNPVPLYDECTNWVHPFLKVKGFDIDLLSVDNLPSILPLESSLDFSSQLIVHLLELNQKEHLPNVWKNALNTFNKNKNI
jgi:saccharopine dehydrogenase (NAD+, L-lysine-forming)